MIPLYETDPGKQTKPLGMPMCQSRLAVPAWSYAMEVLPPARIVELGTYNGGFITALAVHAWNLAPRAEIHTFDLHSGIDEKWCELSRFLGVRYYQGDMWTREKQIAELIASPGVTFVLCDGGNKVRELSTFAAYLKPGDVIAAHDFNVVEFLGVDDEPPYWPSHEIDPDRVASAISAFALDRFEIGDDDLSTYLENAGWLALRKAIAP